MVRNLGLQPVPNVLMEKGFLVVLKQEATKKNIFEKHIGRKNVF